jgi:ferredoxin
MKRNIEDPADKAGLQCLTNNTKSFITYQTTPMRIPIVELSECVFCGVCEEVAPTVFRISDAGFVVVIDLPRYPEIEIEEARRGCPTDCIYWVET